MKKIFIEPSLEVKEFNRVSVLAASETGNVTSAKEALATQGIIADNIVTAIMTN